MRLRTLPLILALTLPLAAQQKRPITFADLQAMHRIADPQISPSGKWVLFSVTDVSLEKNTKTNHLWLVPLAGGKETQLTTGPGESSGRFSPDGKTVLYSAAVNGQDQIQLAAFDDATGTLAPAHPITTLSTGADGAIWAPDSHHILFTSSVYPECESKTPPQGTITATTPPPASTAGTAKTEGAGAFRPLNSPTATSGFSPGETKRAEEEANCNALKDTLAANSPIKAQVIDHLLYRHWNAYTGAKHSHIFYANIDGSAPLDLTPASVIGDHEAPTAFPTGGPLGYAISPDGKEIAYVTNLDKVPAESTNNDIFTLQLGAAPSTAKKVSTSPGSDDGPQYSPDGRLLAWRSQARPGFESDKYELVVMDRAMGKILSLTSKFDGSVDAFTWIDDSQHIWFSSALHGQEVLNRTNVTADDLHPMTKGGGEWGDFTTRLISGRVHAVGTRMWVDRPTEIFNTDDIEDSIPVKFHLSGTAQASHQHVVSVAKTATPQEVGKLTHLNDALLSQLDLPNMDSFTFPGANDTKVQGFLIKPPNFDPSKKYPLKFLIHGGPQGAWGDAWSYRWNPELFAANGYVVVMINPRGSTGYGQQFVDEVSGDWGGRPYIDLMKGLDYAETKFPFIDKTRECALGASYGGFMADYILTHTDRFACIVTHDGMYNPQSAFGTTEELWFNEWEFRPLVGTGPHAVVDQTHPAHPWDFYNLPADQDPFRKFSPMLSIDNAKTPTLVIHGQKDYRLDVSEGLQLFTALQLLHVPSKFLYFPDEGHWVLKPQNSQLWYTTVNDWVDQWTHTNAYAQ